MINIVRSLSGILFSRRCGRFSSSAKMGRPAGLRVLIWLRRYIRFGLVCLIRSVRGLTANRYFPSLPRPQTPKVF
jgi:hypothetical protein